MTELKKISTVILMTILGIIFGIIIYVISAFTLGGIISSIPDNTETPGWVELPFVILFTFGIIVLPAVFGGLGYLVGRKMTINEKLENSGDAIASFPKM